MIRYAILAFFTTGAFALGLGACGDSGNSAGGAELCTPGEEIYCNCQGTREPGTKTCLGDGTSFGPCVGPDGECQEISSTTTTGTPQECEPDSTESCTCDDGVTQGDKTCDEEGSGFGPCLVDGGECAAAGTLGFFEVCAVANECLSGICEGFCTRACESYQDCQESDTLYGDCVDFGTGTKHCAPYCLSQEDCAPYGQDAICSGIEDPTWIFAACGPFQAPQGMPYGTLCEPNPPQLLVGDPDNPVIEDGDCHLGLAGVQNVCVFGECSKACYEDIDCPADDCTSDGTTPGCCLSDPDCG